MASTSIFNWNVRGLRANTNDLNLLSTSFFPSVICLQETLLPANTNWKLGGFCSYHLFSLLSGNKPTGGVSICVKSDIPQSRINITTPLQAVAVSVSLFKTITICSVYLPPSDNIQLQPLIDLYNQLPKPAIIVGDFNAHNPLWGSRNRSPRGQVIEDWVGVVDLCLMNSGHPTYTSSGTGTQSCLDLSVCSASLFPDFTWHVLEDTYGSDHHPTYVESMCPPPVSTPAKWKLHKADWDSFSKLCDENLIGLPYDVDSNPVGIFTSTLLDVARSTIPRTSSKPAKRNKPWFNAECRAAINRRKAALRRVHRFPTQVYIDAFKIARAKARRTICQAKANSWREYVSRLSSNTSSKKVWDMVRRIRGNTTSASIHHLVVNNTRITSPRDIANALGESISSISSSNHHTPSFHQHKLREERTPVDLTSDNMETYNAPFSLTELKNALRRCHDTSPGPDDIHYQMLKHLPGSCLVILLDNFNRVWEDGKFPDEWHLANLIPIPKPGKDPSNPANVRPIALTSCICKLMERMVVSRLNSYLESKNLLTPLQSGFRKGRSTYDHLVRLETWAREAFLNKHHLVAVFFDLEKAYDTMWKYGVIKDLHNMGIRGNLLSFIDNFLKDRKFRVRVGSSYSDIFRQEDGFPQGSIISVVSFAVKVNSIVSCLSPGVEGFLYVDDFGIAYSSPNMRTINR